jgi:predicted DNA-binding transcriptional regulator AlpA
MATDNPINPTFIPARRVWERYGVTSMTLHRWLADERLDFPRPVYIGRMRFWRVADLEAWEAEQARRGAAA